MKVRLGLGAFRSFKRLSYTPWHALAEFIDNSTQSYADHQDDLDSALDAAGEKLTVEITYSTKNGGSLRISDNAMGMSSPELDKALVVGEPPPAPLWRSRYGFGLKTAASWFGDLWTVETKRLGSTRSIKATVDVEKVAAGNALLDVRKKIGLPRDEHYTVIEIKELNQLMHWRTLEKTRDHLRSMYRNDLQEEKLRLVWNGVELSWQDEEKYAELPAGNVLHRTFELRVGKRRVRGAAGVLARGSRRKAGFAILYSGRVIKGPPAAWKPEEIFGQPEGSNTLVSQRLVGEVILDGYNVTHTKDGILWVGDEEEALGVALEKELSDLIAAAKELRSQAGRAPSLGTARKVGASLQRLLTSSELRRKWLLAPTPRTSRLAKSSALLVEAVTQRPPDFTGALNGIVMRGYLGSEMVDTDSYVAVESEGNRLAIVINMKHPFVQGLKEEGLRSHVEHCAFDAIAEWRAKHDDLPSDPLTLTFLKDGLLRIASPGSK